MGGAEAFGHFGKGLIFFERDGTFFEEIFDEVVKEIFLLPAVEIGVEGRHEFEILWNACIEEAIHLLEGGAVEREALLERGVLHGK